MISVMCSRSSLSTATLILYTCVWIPFHQLKKSLFHLLDYLLLFSRCRTDQETALLPAAIYQDVRQYSGAAETEQEEACPICLVQLESEDVVSKLPKCGHVFHLHCIEKWLEKDQFTCPLCRALLFSSLTSSHTKYCDNLMSPHSLSTTLDYSFLSF